MRSIDSATLAALDNGEIIQHVGIVFDFPSGTYPFWTGLGPFTWNGLTFLGAGSLFELSDYRETADMEAVSTVVQLRALPDDGLTGDVLATIDQEAYSQRPVSLYHLWFHPDTLQLLSVETLFRGYVDQIVHKESDGVYMLEAHLESRARDLTKRGVRVRSPHDQRKIDPADTGLDYAATHPHETIYFGQSAPKKKREA